MGDRGEGFRPPDVSKGKEVEKEKYEFELAKELIGLAEQTDTDIGLEDLIPFGTIDTNKGWTVQAWRSTRAGELFQRLCDILDIKQEARSYAINTLSGREYEEDYGDEKTRSLKELLEIKSISAVVAQFYAITKEMSQTLAEAANLSPEAEQTPEMYLSRLEIPAKFFKRACEIIGHLPTVEEEE